MATFTGAKTSVSKEFPASGIAPGLFETIDLIINYI
jgi:hypothetical protein